MRRRGRKLIEALFCQKVKGVLQDDIHVILGLFGDTLRLGCLDVFAELGTELLAGLLMLLNELEDAIDGVLLDALGL